MEFQNKQFLMIDRDDQEYTVDILDVKKSQKCPPRYQIMWKGKKCTIELQCKDDERVLFEGTLQGFPYVQAYLIMGSKQSVQDVYLKVVQ